MVGAGEAIGFGWDENENADVPAVGVAGLVAGVVDHSEDVVVVGADAAVVLNVLTVFFPQVTMMLFVYAWRLRCYAMRK